MNGLIFLAVLFIGLTVIINVILYIRLGRKRTLRTQAKLSEISGSIDKVINIIHGYECSAITRDNSLRSFASKNQQKLENAINQSAKNNEDRIGQMENRIVNEIQASSSGIQSSIQHSYSGFFNSFKSKLNDIRIELTELHQNLQEFKEDILRTQAQSFLGMENRMGTIRDEEHRFVEYELVGSIIHIP